MSVVPLRLGESVVNSEDAFQKASGFEGSALLIFNLDENQLSGASSNVREPLKNSPIHRRSG
jgi:hypothetical protein